MSALLQDFAVTKDDDVVCVLDSGQTMCYDEHSANGHHLFKGVLNQLFSFGVNVGGGFVKDHNLGFADHCASKGDELALTGGEVVASFADFFIKAVSQLVDEFVCVDVGASLHNFLIGEFFITEDDVASYCACKEEHVLKHLTEVLSER